MRVDRWLAAGLVAAACGMTAAAADWPQFRGPARDGISREAGLLRQWPAAGPKALWTVPVGQGYAGAAIVAGRVYHHDYKEETGEWSIVCRNLLTGKEIWRFAEVRKIRPNHSILRSVPAVDGKFLVSVDPKCGVHGLDARTGKRLWYKDLVTTHKARIPPWYNGQNPLLEPGRVIIATGGDALLVAFDMATGKELWRTANPDGALMSHVSVMPAVLGGVKQYLYANLDGVFGVNAADGKLLWNFKRKFNVAAAPSPLAVDATRIFVTGPYDAGSSMLKLARAGAGWQAESVVELKTNDWNSEVHTPIVDKGHFFGIGKKRRGLFTCLNFDGKTVWDSDGKASFELGSYLLADGMFFVLDGKSGMLRLIESNTTGYKELAKAQVLNGEDVWGPMALSDGKLVLRDMTKMVCLDVRGK